MKRALIITATPSQSINAIKYCEENGLEAFGLVLRIGSKHSYTQNASVFASASISFCFVGIKLFPKRINRIFTAASCVMIAYLLFHYRTLILGNPVCKLQRAILYSSHHKRRVIVDDGLANGVFFYRMRKDKDYEKKNMYFIRKRVIFYSAFIASKPRNLNIVENQPVKFERAPRPIEKFWFLGQPLVSGGRIRPASYNLLLNELFLYIEKEYNFKEIYYIKHRVDTVEDFAAMRKRGIPIIDFGEPVESAFEACPFQGVGFFSFCSSASINMARFFSAPSYCFLLEEQFFASPEIARNVLITNQVIRESATVEKNLFVIEANQWQAQ